MHTPANSTDPYALSYAEIVVPLVKAVQEQQKMIDSMKVVLQTLHPQGTLNKSMQNSNSLGLGNSETTLQVELANGSQPILYQNEPNPFSESTVIRYFIPEDLSGNAYYVFYDIQGKEIKNFKVDRTFNSLLISTSDIPSGTYYYQLQTNGQSSNGKKLIVIK